MRSVRLIHLFLCDETNPAGYGHDSILFCVFVWILCIFDSWPIISTHFSLCCHQLNESEQQSGGEIWSQPTEWPKGSSGAGQVFNSSQETTRTPSRRQQTSRRTKVCEREQGFSVASATVPEYYSLIASICFPLLNRGGLKACMHINAVSCPDTYNLQICHVFMLQCLTLFYPLMSIVFSLKKILLFKKIYIFYLCYKCIF